MGLLAPIGLVFGLLALPILALYMLKLRRQDVQVSSTMLWSALLRDRQANTPWQRLKRNLLLLIQLLTLAALVLALARPAVAVQTIASGSLVIILDSSASMSASDEAPSRFEAARSTARSLIAGLEAGARLTLIEAANPGMVLVNAEIDQTKSLAALNAARPSTGSPDWSQTFALAAGASAALGPATTIVILSDGGLPTTGLPPLPGTVRFVSFGQSEQNLAIRALAVRPEGEGALQLFASVQNYGTSEHLALLSIDADGQFNTSRQIKVPPGASLDLVIRGLPGSTRVFKAALLPPEDSGQPLDMLALDNTAFALNDLPAQRKAIVISQDQLEDSGENIFLMGMLSAAGFKAVQPVLNLDASGGQISQQVILTDTLYNLVVLDGVLPAEIPTNSSLLIINPPASIPGILNVGETITDVQTPGLAPDFLTDNLLRQIAWEPVYIAKTRRILNAGWAQPVVISGASRPLVLRGELNGQRIAILAFDLHDSNLPLELAYPILMTSLLDYLAPQSALENSSANLQPGDPVNIRPQPGVQEVLIGRPDGSYAYYQNWMPPIIFGDTGQLGIYAVNLLRNKLSSPPEEELSKNFPEEYFAINLFNPQESNIKPQTSLQLGQNPVAADLPSAVSLRELWPWLAGLAFVLLLIEWFVYHRKLGFPGSNRINLRRLSASLSQWVQKLPVFRWLKQGGRK